MSRYLEPKCRLCRQEGVKLFLKGSRCETAMCAVARHPYRPGMHGNKRAKKTTPYGVHLRETQKLKRIYGVHDAIFRNYFEKAQRMPGNTGENLLFLLERRLDNVVYKVGFALSRAQARQMVNHGHFTVNGKNVDVPSYLVSQNDVIRPRAREKSVKLVKENLELSVGINPPAWVEVTKPEPGKEGEMDARVTRVPARDEISVPVNELLVVEFCSR